MNHLPWRRRAAGLFLGAVILVNLGCIFEGLFGLFEDGERPPGTSSTSTASSASSSSIRERLFLGTGEYDPASLWDAVLRFDDSGSIAGSAATPDGTVPVKQVTSAGSGMSLNFAHSIFYDRSRDELYLASLFTNGVPPAPSGSIGVLANASSANGASVMVRHIFGPSIPFNKPHGVWVDTTRDILYAANTFAENILVWDHASGVDGDIPPDRIITYSGSFMGKPVNVFVEPVSDLMFVATMQSTAIAGGMGGPAIFVFKNASSLQGDRTPDVRIYGGTTRIDAGNNQTTHNVWYDATTGLMFVGHHTNEVLIFDLSGVNLAPAIVPTDYTALAPRVLQINQNADNSDQYDWSCYGLFYLAEQDRLYVSAGHTQGGTATTSGPPGTGLTDHAVRVYDGVSASSVSGVYPPTRNIFWSSVTTYYPPQPLWIDRYAP